MTHRIVGADAAKAVKGDQAVLAGAAGHHIQAGLPPGQPILGGVGAVPQRDQKRLPGEQFLKWEVSGQAQVVAQLSVIYDQILRGKHPPHICGQGCLLRADPQRARLHQFDVLRITGWRSELILVSSSAAGVTVLGLEAQRRIDGQHLPAHLDLQAHAPVLHHHAALRVHDCDPPGA